MPWGPTRMLMAIDERKHWQFRWLRRRCVPLPEARLSAAGGSGGGVRFVEGYSAGRSVPLGGVRARQWGAHKDIQVRLTSTLRRTTFPTAGWEVTALFLF